MPLRLEPMMLGKLCFIPTENNRKAYPNQCFMTKKTPTIPQEKEAFAQAKVMV